MSFTYNDFRRETVQTNERGFVRDFFFDAAAPAIQSYASGTAIAYDYDENGNPITATVVPASGAGQSNRITSTQYDELDRPVRIVGPQYTDAVYGTVCPVTLDSYDTLGRLVQVSAGRSPAPCTGSDVVQPQLTRVYDDFDRLTSETDALGHVRSLHYDTHDNPDTATDARNQTTQYTWAYGHQLMSRIEQSGRTTTWTRNALGQVTKVVHPNVTTSTEYDAAHRVVEIIDSRGSQSLEYDWSPGGLLNSLTDSANRITGYLYDPVGRLAAITAPNGDSINFSFDPAGRLIQKRLANGTSSHYQYNPDGSLAQLVNSANGSLISQHDYSYDGTGNRITQSEKINGTTINYAYSYDELGRLTQVANGTAANQENYSYDPLNNRTAKSVGQSSPAITAYVYDAANQLTQIHSGSATGPLLKTLAYDNNGNLQSDGTRTYTWDALNQLSQVSTSSITTRYAYDDTGRRIAKTSAGSTTQWLYDGQDIYVSVPTLYRWVPASAHA
jgi:YD repeat-containing protein